MLKNNSFVIMILALIFLISSEKLCSQDFIKISAGNIVNDQGSTYECKWGDYNSDGYLDIFVCNLPEVGYGVNFFYRNNKNGTFTKIIDSEIVTFESKTFGCAWCDYDNDNDLDIYIASQLSIGCGLYENMNSDVVFRKNIKGDLSGAYSAHSCAWADYDNDGLVDLFVCKAYNTLYHNDGNGTFSIDKVIYPSEDPYQQSASFYDCGWGDYDNDGDLDLFLLRNYYKSHLYKNNGDKTFTRVTSGNIVTDRGLGQKCRWVDYDNDCDLDLFVLNWVGNNFLYSNNGNGNFTRIANNIIVTEGSDRRGFSWGDYDNDGDLDLFVAQANNKNLLFSNNGDGTFIKVENSLICTDNGFSFAGSWGDYDKDGDLDLFVANANGENNALYRNNGNSNSWINIKLVGVMSNRSAIGAKLKVKATINGKSYWQFREISSKKFLNAHFGLGNAPIVEKIMVYWPSGIIQSLANISVNQYITIVESSNHPPIANAGNDQIVEATSPLGAEVILDGSASYDPDGDQLIYTWRENGTIIADPTECSTVSVILGLGRHIIEISVDDGKGGIDTDQVVIDVIDTTPPEICISVTPDTLWPPNHKMVDITANVSVSDICDPNPDWFLVSIESNEPEEGPGRKNFPDIEGHEIGTPDTEFKLRAERIGKHHQDRIYTITYKALDASGNEKIAEATVVVPHHAQKPDGFAANDSINSLKMFTNYPNPFNPETEIRFNIASLQHVKITIFNTLGQKIRTLVNDEISAGSHFIKWDGKDDYGNYVSAGLYLCNIHTEHYHKTISMLLLK